MVISCTPQVLPLAYRITTIAGNTLVSGQDGMVDYSPVICSV